MCRYEEKARKKEIWKGIPYDIGAPTGLVQDLALSGLGKLGHACYAWSKATSRDAPLR